MTTTTESKEKVVPPVVLPVSLRDYFAAHAPPLFDVVKIAPNTDSGYMLKMLESIAKWNYSYAATMLAQREKP